MTELRFKPYQIPPGSNEITICQYEDWPDGKRRTEHYRAFDKWIRENRPHVNKAKYHCWPYNGCIVCE